mmetsp:Transcript_3985/g.10030  ORF Transcript_3985/g.10030 Transcript_3985/m.10030 type:complete len:253 (-) Transcript_3985:284-1042(-)
MGQHIHRRPLLLEHRRSFLPPGHRQHHLQLHHTLRPRHRLELRHCHLLRHLPLPQPLLRVVYRLSCRPLGHRSHHRRLLRWRLQPSLLHSLLWHRAPFQAQPRVLHQVLLQLQLRPHCQLQHQLRCPALCPLLSPAYPRPRSPLPRQVQCPRAYRRTLPRHVRRPRRRPHRVHSLHHAPQRNRRSSRVQGPRRCHHTFQHHSPLLSPLRIPHPHLQHLLRALQLRPQVACPQPSRRQGHQLFLLLGQPRVPL